MCTAATYRTKDFYFGRTLDYEFSYGDEVTVTPWRGSNDHSPQLSICFQAYGRGEDTLCNHWYGTCGSRLPALL